MQNELRSQRTIYSKTLCQIQIWPSLIPGIKTLVLWNIFTLNEKIIFRKYLINDIISTQELLVFIVHVFEGL